MDSLHPDPPEGPCVDNSPLVDSPPSDRPAGVPSAGDLPIIEPVVLPPDELAEDVPERVPDDSLAERDRARKWVSDVYLPALDAARWRGVAPGKGAELLVAYVGAETAPIRAALGLGPSDRIAVIPLGNLGLAPINARQASERRKFVYEQVGLARTRGILLSPEKAASSNPITETEEAMLVPSFPEERILAICSEFAQPFCLVDGPDGRLKRFDARTPPLVAAYVNRRGHPVTLHITAHARKRFALRIGLLDPNKAPPLDLDWAIARRVCAASRVENLDQHERRRQHRYGGDTVFLRNGPLTFVVRNGAVVTIEISGGGKRHLNRFVPPPLDLTGGAATLGAAMASAAKSRLWFVSYTRADAVRGTHSRRAGQFWADGSLSSLASSPGFAKFLRDAMERDGTNRSDLLSVFVTEAGKAQVRLVDMDVLLPTLKALGQADRKA